MIKSMECFIPVLILFIASVQAGESDQPVTSNPIQVSGVFPHLAMVAEHSPRTEAGIGGLMPWAGRLWAVTYVAHLEGTGSGTGLYEIDANLILHKRPESVVGTYANRLIHGGSNQAIIGPYIIDTQGTVRVIKGIQNHRLAATMEHLTDPKNKVYFLGMEGEFFEVDVHTLETKKLFDLMKVLDEPKGSKPHFKSAFTHHGCVVVANNSYNERDYNGHWRAGRLAEWDGERWTIIEHTAFTEVWGARASKSPMIATGWDAASVILRVYCNGRWSRYRLPKGSHTFDETSYTEWMRIREVETERALMDCHGLFYEVPYHTYNGQLWGIRPISRHLRMIPDFCSWRGMLVLGGNQATPMQFSNVNDRNPLAGQPQAGLWFGKTDDLWGFGKPQGHGGVWRDKEVKAQETSDPYLFFGFDKKAVHLRNGSDYKTDFVLEVDFLGNGTWDMYSILSVAPRGYTFHVFPEGYSAEWIRVRSLQRSKATVWFVYN
jgi:hypothetical protein